MDDFKVIFRILKALQKAMDEEEIDEKMLTHEKLGISQPRWSRIMAMLVKNGYIEGVTVESWDNLPLPFIEFYKPEITLKGLEYLAENSLMRKIANAGKEVMDILK